MNDKLYKVEAVSVETGDVRTIAENKTLENAQAIEADAPLKKKPEELFVAHGKMVTKKPVEKKNPDGSKTVTVGFPVCEVSDYVEAIEVARVLTQGELYPQTAAKLAKMETKHGPADADEVEHYEACECCGNFDRMEKERDELVKALKDVLYSCVKFEYEHDPAVLNARAAIKRAGDGR